MKQDVLDHDLLARAEKVALESGKGLWDALAGIVIREGKQLPRNIYVDALTHCHDKLEKTFVLTRQEILDGGIDSITQRLSDQEGLSLCSEVRNQGYTYGNAFRQFPRKVHRMCAGNWSRACLKGRRSAKASLALRVLGELASPSGLVGAT
jgi:hypothetical protein